MINLFPQSGLHYRRYNTICRASKANDSIQVRFSIPYRCNFGQHLRIVGSADSLGAWDLDKALPMTWNDGDIWTADVALPSKNQVAVEYKYVVCNEQGGAAWKPGGNFLLSIPDTGNGSVKIKDAWDDAFREVQIETIRAVRGRKSKSGNDSSTEEDEAVEAISKSAKNALNQLENVLNTSFELIEKNSDAASAELLAADLEVAAAAQRAATMTKALNVVKSPREKLLE